MAVEGGNLVAVEGNLVAVEGNPVAVEGNLGNLVVVEGSLLGLDMLAVGNLLVVDDLVEGIHLGLCLLGVVPLVVFV